MKTFPLQSITIENAKQKQFDLVDCITREFEGDEVLSLGDLGVVSGVGKPKTAQKVERVIAAFFGVESAALCTGAGTGAIRLAIQAACSCSDKILVHSAPIYPTTKTIIENMNLNIVYCDFNDIDSIAQTIEKHNDIKLAIVQHTRQKLDDAYNLHDVIAAIKQKDIKIIVDDNYAVMKVDKIGAQLGADISAFSSFKLLGPEGVGVIIGSKELVEKADSFNYSGGSKVQGFQAMEVLRGLVYAPVSLAIQAEENEKLISELNGGKIPQIKNAFLANAQSKVLLVEFAEPIAKLVLEKAKKLGAAPNPVGAESKYEISPMFYRVSGTFLKADPTLESRMIRINPNRSGAQTILRILQKSIEQ